MEKIKNNEYKRELLIKKLTEFSKYLGRTPRYRDLKGISRPSWIPCSDIYVVFFGSWNNAIKESGLIANLRGNIKGRSLLNKDLMILKLQELSLSLGRTLTRDESATLCKSGKCFSPSSYVKHFRSWSNALKIAGLVPNERHNVKGSDRSLKWGSKMAELRRKYPINFPGNPYSNLRLRFNVLKRDNFTCQYCGRTPQDGARLVIDHKFAVANGGPTNMDNLITSCFECNAGKGDIILSSYKPRKRAKKKGSDVGV